MGKTGAGLSSYYCTRTSHHGRPIGTSESHPAITEFSSHHPLRHHDPNDHGTKTIFPCAAVQQSKSLNDHSSVSSLRSDEEAATTTAVHLSCCTLRSRGERQNVETKKKPSQPKMRSSRCAGGWSEPQATTDYSTSLATRNPPHPRRTKNLKSDTLPILSEMSNTRKKNSTFVASIDDASQK